MTSLDPAATAAVAPLLLRRAPALYAATLFASALLLFSLQPLFTKMVLPVLGGSPSVWSVAMVFFQGALLAGYFYAHWLSRTFAPGTAALVHLILLGVAALTLPVAISEAVGAPPAFGVELWLIALFTTSIGLPLVALSASAPLLQNWFAASSHPQAGNPYVFYAASNLGSFAALLSYPFLIEPLLTVRAQTIAWSAGFAGLAALVAVAGLVVARAASPLRSAGVADSGTWRGRFAWIALSAIPSGLVIGVTAYLTTDIAAAPFLWAIPLALYLLTFVAVFRDRPWVSSRLTAALVPFAAAFLSIGVLGGDKTYWFASILLSLCGFLVFALHCHGELYARRPAPARLTEFYLMISVGGLVGGIFAGLVAPNMFNNTWEYPILIAAAVLTLPGTFAGGLRAFWRESSIPLALAAALIAVALLTDYRLGYRTAFSFTMGVVALLGVMIYWRRRPARLFGLVVLAFVITGFWQPGLAPVETARSFFGVHKVLETADGAYRLLFHGTTVHGAERLRERDGSPTRGAPEPLTYYYHGGPISEAIATARTVQGELRGVAAVGLGTGSLACHARADENWTFFEIDPEVIRIARDPRLFRFISSCAPNVPIVLGDARLTLAAARDQFGLIVLDAFSSDAIPVHLLTREAFAGYLRRLRPRGMIVVHISNRHMELSRVTGAVAHSLGLVGFERRDDSANSFLVDYKANALVAVFARDEADLGELPVAYGWRRIDPAGVAAWTDDYSNLLGAIYRKKFGD